jgi:hypothetical protein
MLGLPKSTEISKQLPKKAIYAKFNMNTAAKEKFDADISRIMIVNEISAATTAIAKGKEITSFYVLQVALKKKEFEERTIVSITKLIPQNILLLLECGTDSKLAIYRGKLMQTEWKPSDSLAITLKGLDLDAVWENVVVQVGNVEIEQGNTLDEQIAIDEQRAKLQKEIAKLEKLARAEKQPKKKFEIVQNVKQLNDQLSELSKKNMED